MFKIKDDCENIIVYFERKYMSEEVVTLLKNYLLGLSSPKRVAINLENIESTQNEFFTMLKDCAKSKKISLFNTSADINLLLFLMNYNQYTKLYVNERDFKEEKRELVNRNFKFCAS